jgi:uncharacterized protein (DUF305 family)
MTTTRFPRLAVLIATAAVALVVAACGGTSGSSSGDAAGNGTDVAFIDGMTPHHQSAIDMARIAQQRATTGYVSSLAGDIVQAQSAEIAAMRKIKSQLSGVAKGDLGMSMEDMGMSMDDAMLKTAKPFDRAFVDMMIPHHQGAIRMARIELANGKNPQLRKIANAVVAAQSREIKSMNEFRKETYGAPSPAGGVPKPGTSGASMDGMEGMEG